jgi:2-aminoethylphosphonate-pyruvate transaminase
VDYGSRDPAFVAMSDAVRARLAALPGVPDLVAVPIQGSGTFAVEAMVGTLLPRDGHLLVVINGAYGDRILEIARAIGRVATPLSWAEDEAIEPARIDEALVADPSITHVAIVHCETTTGTLNPLAEVAKLVRRRGRRLLVDAMSSFGAIPLGLGRDDFDAVAASSNKCLEGVPGLGFVVTKPELLAACRGRSPSVALDLWSQQQRFAKDGQWRFTPPTQVVAALHEAILAHEAEGGVAGRGARYRESCRVLVESMRALGFRTLLPDARQAPIIVTFKKPADPAYDFERFYDGLRDRGFAIYPGKLTKEDTFRVGCIGQVFPDDLRRFATAVRDVMDALGLASGAPAAGGY